MARRILQSALLSLSVSLTGCAVYEVESRGYSVPHYKGYGYQPPVYPRSYYPQYPQYPRVQVYRYPRAPLEQVYRQPPAYRAAPLWSMDAPRYEVEHPRHRQPQYREERRERYPQQAREGRYERHEGYGPREGRQHQPNRGWEVQGY